MMQTLPDSSELSTSIRMVLFAFVQKAKEQGYEEAHIEAVIARTLTLDYNNIKRSLTEYPELNNC